jgi:hypothetical protein
MKGQRFLLLLAVAICLSGALPASALAGVGWSVRNTAGTVVGKCYDASGFLSVYKGRTYKGFVAKDGGRWFVHITSSKHLCQVIKQTQSRWINYHDGVIGKITRTGGNWVLKNRNSAGHYVTRGKVSASCPAQLAGAALRLIW